jgi:hypothetical protein
MSDLPWEWRFENDPDPVAPSVMCMMGTARGAMGVTVSWDADEEDAAVCLADEWNEQVFETLAEDDLDLAQRWPPCPRLGHHHALEPMLYRILAAWICHKDRTVIAIIGQLRNR